MYDIIIVGAGTAGMSAAIYGLRAGKKVLMLEGKSYGGQIVNTPEVENYPGIQKVSGFEFATNLLKQATDLGAEIIYEKAESIQDNAHYKTVVTARHQYETRTVIIATGAKNRPLGLEKEEKLIGAGVSYCATCDGMFFRGKDVAVVGGGSTALEDAVFLSNFCAKVYLIHRRDSFRGEEKLVEALREKENVVFVLDSVVTDILGDNTVSGVTVKNVKDETYQEISVSGVFIAIGQQPDNDNFADLIMLDEKGYVRAGEDCITNVDGIFTAGDCRTKTVRQLTTAASDGAVAALAACEYMIED